MTIYEIKKFGVTVEWTDNLKEAESSFKDVAPGECVMYKIQNAQKTPIKQK